MQMNATKRFHDRNSNKISRYDNRFVGFIYHKNFDLHLLHIAMELTFDRMEEIGEIIESAPTTPLIIADEPRCPTQTALPVQATRQASSVVDPLAVVKPPARSLAYRRVQNCGVGGGRSCDVLEDVGDWSKFNTIIANEIDELTRELEQKRNKEGRRGRTVVQYKELLNELGISDSESSVGSSCEASTDRSSFRPRNASRDRRNGKLFSDETADRFLLSSDYDEPRDSEPVSNDRTKSGSLPEDLQRVVVGRGRCQDRQDRRDVPDVDCHEPSFLEDRGRFEGNNSSLSYAKLDRTRERAAEKDEEEEDSTLTTRVEYLANSCDQPKKQNVEISSRTNEEVDVERRAQIGSGNRLVVVDGCAVKDESNAKLPPRQRIDAHRKTSLPVNLACQNRRRAPRLARIRRNDDQTMDPEYELDEDRVHQSLVPRSAPVTPTEEKKSPFSKFLWKKHAPVFHENAENDVVLVRVSSLPDQDFLQMGNETTLRVKNGRVSLKDLTKKRAVSPLTLRSDISAKRLSESDKDVRQVSPVDLKKYSLSRSRGNDVGVSCDLPENEHADSTESVDSGKFDRAESVDVKKMLDEQNSRSGSIRNGSGSCCPNSPPMDSLACSDMATQTSPAISRSSSFTWVSDCESPRESQMDSQSLQDESTLDPGSPQDTVDDDNRSSSSSQDLLQSMDEISSGSLSPDTTDRASPLESGIGTASPPRSTDRRIVKPPSSGKCHRKETWERIRRRPSKLNSRNDKHSQDVWIKRESVHTQTKEIEDRYSQEAVDSSSGLDDTLPRIKPPRPNNLPLCLSTTASSSLSSGELLETPPRAPSSPSAASLQLKPEPLSVEMGGKSSSAPLLENNDAAKTNGTVPHRANFTLPADRPIEIFAAFEQVALAFDHCCKFEKVTADDISFCIHSALQQSQSLQQPRSQSERQLSDVEHTHVPQHATNFVSEKEKERSFVWLGRKTLCKLVKRLSDACDEELLSLLYIPQKGHFRRDGFSPHFLTGTCKSVAAFDVQMRVPLSKKNPDQLVFIAVIEEIYLSSLADKEMRVAGKLISLSKLVIRARVNFQNARVESGSLDSASGNQLKSLKRGNLKEAPLNFRFPRRELESRRCDYEAEEKIAAKLEGNKRAEKKLYKRIYRKMSTEEGRASTPAGSGVIDETGRGGSRRMSHSKEYKFFRSFSAKVENWPMRKAEALWRRMRERKIADILWKSVLNFIRANLLMKFLFDVAREANYLVKVVSTLFEDFPSKIFVTLEIPNEKHAIVSRKAQSLVDSLRRETKKNRRDSPSLMDPREWSLTFGDNIEIFIVWID
ncbi:hypothetical protein WN51_10130 [Melipona quadrifasciata]|uniref:Uncharacterized protein n=1 Tax=Melipona quadrifasciata TaxID=166423 RepID=A0A0M9AA02_9HYME|nr:hypothetical protein WN51_10130 [Melipona quadrifasciata]